MAPAQCHESFPYSIISTHWWSGVWLVRSCTEAAKRARNAFQPSASFVAVKYADLPTLAADKDAKRFPSSPNQFVRQAQPQRLSFCTCTCTPGAAQ